MGQLVVGRLKGGWWPWFLLLTVACSPSWGQPVATSDWKQKIIRQLQSNVQLPPEACGRTGEVKLAFTLDRSGKVIFSKLASRSGVAALDAAAAAAVKGDRPFPPAPPEVVDNDLKFLVVLVFLEREGVSTEDVRRRCELLRDEIKLRNRLRGVCRGC